MRNIAFVTALAIGLGIAASVALPYGPAADAQAQRGAPPSRAALTYVAKAGAADLYEIESSRIALRRARRPAVREFAQMLIADHSRTTAQVAAAARADGIDPPPPMLEPAQRTMIRQLSRAGNQGFDQAYLNQQVTAHQQALSLHRNQARSGAGDDLRRVAAAAVPVIEGHLSQARRLARSR